MTQLVKKGEFARMKGWAPSYVTKLLKADKLVLAADGKRIDVELSNRRLDELKSVNGEGLREYHQAQRDEKGVIPEIALGASADKIEAGKDGGGESERDAAPASPQPKDPNYERFNQARADREAENAKLQKMERMRREGLLVEADAVKKAGRRLAEVVGAGLDQIAPRIGSMMAMEPDPKKRDLLLEREIRKVRDELANSIEQLAAMLAQPGS